VLELCDTFIVFRRVYCRACSGSGKNRHVLWDKYWQSAKLKTVEELMVFMQNEGESTVPAEMAVCNECVGVGYIDHLIELKQALAELEK
jgi:hypothetical protein